MNARTEKAIRKAMELVKSGGPASQAKEVGLAMAIINIRATKKTGNISFDIRDANNTRICQFSLESIIGKRYKAKKGKK